jgi:microsomal dipeptidase-like Zn-dependent dipeptidase
MTKEPIPIVDLHCDLLSYLSHAPERSPFDPMSRCSLLQMKKGHVALQVLAIFSPESHQAVAKCKKEVDLFQNIMISYPSHIASLQINQLESSFQNKKIQILPAFENSAGFGPQTNPMTSILFELMQIKKRLGPIAYISLTWDEENRFGGGCRSNIGLKDDGKDLLAWMNESYIPVDVSHASDFLIADIFNEVDKKNYTLPILASHSNFRSITAKPRNLPDEFAKEIIKRNGVIGMNFFKHFSKGDSPTSLIEHILHALSLQGGSNLCFGADFFADTDFPYLKQKYQNEHFFYDELSDSSCYPFIVEHLRDQISIPHDLIENILFKNAQNFFQKIVHMQSLRSLRS